MFRAVSRDARICSSATIWHRCVRPSLRYSTRVDPYDEHVIAGPVWPAGFRPQPTDEAHVYTRLIYRRLTASLPSISASVPGANRLIARMLSALPQYRANRRRMMISSVRLASFRSMFGPLFLGVRLTLRYSCSNVTQHEAGNIRYIQ